MKKISALALIELTALCDVLGVDLKRSKAGKLKAAGQQSSGSPVAGVLAFSSRGLRGDLSPRHARRLCFFP